MLLIAFDRRLRTIRSCMGSCSDGYRLGSYANGQCIFYEARLAGMLLAMKKLLAQYLKYNSMLVTLSSILLPFLECNA